MMDSNDSSFRSLLPHEPLPQEPYGYLHIQGSFEAKRPKLSQDDDAKDVPSVWTVDSLRSALESSPEVRKLNDLKEICILDHLPPFTKARFVLESPQAAYNAMQSWKRDKMTPYKVLQHSPLLQQDGLCFSTRQLLTTQLTTKPMLATNVAWTRSNPPKFRRLLHSLQDTLSLEEERRLARFVFVSDLLPSGAAPDEWLEHGVEAIRTVATNYDSTGDGVEVFWAPKKPHYCHVGMRRPQDAQALIVGLQGKLIEWKLPPNDSSLSSGKLFLDYATITQRSVARGLRTEGVPDERGEPSRPECTSTTDSVLVPGLHLVHDFLSPEEEQVILAAITGPHAPWAPSQVVPSKTGSVRRRVQHYGYVFDYETADVLRDRQPDNAACPPMPAIPWENQRSLEEYMKEFIDQGRGWEALAGLIERTRRYEFENGATYTDINQMTVNEYRPGEGIGSHVDTLSAFGDGLISISLSSGVVMEFRHTIRTEKKLLYLPARSLVLMSGPARHEWQHMIVTRTTDTHNGQVIPRGVRVSLTLRTALGLPEQGAHSLPRVESSIFPPKWGNDNDTESSCWKTPSTERDHVHAVYDAIATQWHHTRGKRGVLWPGATQFLQQLPSGSIIADVGCGDGKYFPAIWEAGSYVIGTDISLPLLQMSVGASVESSAPENRQVSHHRTQLRDRPAVAVADCIHVPLRDNSMDAAICVAVLHHLSTQDRRLRCLQELARIVKPGGLINVQAWAMDQEETSRRKFASTDVFVPFNAQPKYLEKAIQQRASTSDKNQSIAEVFAEAYEGAEYDERKGLVVFKRYCHLYRQGEMEDLASRVEGVRLVESGFESGNYYVILQKI